MRACEQVRTDICYANLPVRIVATHGGLTTGAGPTHYGQEDMAIMRSLPNMTVIAPGDPNQIGKVVEASIEWEGPMYIRIGRGGEPVVYKEDYTYEIGKSITVREGDHITLIATGSIVFYAVAAAEMLAAEGIRARVIDMHTIKPLDRQAVIKAAKETGAINTAEDHNIYGGLGSAVAEVLAEEGLACKFRRLGIPTSLPATVNRNTFIIFTAMMRKGYVPPPKLCFSTASGQRLRTKTTVELLTRKNKEQLKRLLKKPF